MDLSPSQTNNTRHVETKDKNWKPFFTGFKLAKFRNIEKIKIESIGKILCIGNYKNTFFLLNYQNNKSWTH